MLCISDVSLEMVDTEKTSVSKTGVLKVVLETQKSSLAAQWLADIRNCLEDSCGTFVLVFC